MEILFYNISDEPNKLNKTLANENAVNGKFTGSFEIVSPTVVVRGNINANYCYIAALKRYYFINSITFNGDKSYISLSCDVLMSHKEDIEKTTVHVIENNTGEPFISNRNNNFDVRPHKEIISFDGQFEKSNIIMVTLKGDK